MSEGTWIISIDPQNQPWVVKILPATRIGPFRDMAEAEAARAELTAANKKEVKQ